MRQIARICLQTVTKVYVAITTLVNNVYLRVRWSNSLGHCYQRGEDKEIKSGLFSNFRKEIQQEVDKKIVEGYDEINDDDLFTFLIEFNVDGHGTTSDVDKRHKLEDKMKEVLGRSRPGDCDGESIGSATMKMLFCC